MPCVSAAFESSRLPEQGHLRLEAGDDRLEVGLFICNWSFLGDLQSFVRPLKVDERGRDPGEEILKERIECRPQERIDPTFEMRECDRGIADPVAQGGAGIGWRRRPTRV
jgi:hypothetical protein